MIESYLPSLSTYSADIDNLFTLITVIVGVWFILAEVVFFYFILRFRKKEGVAASYISGEKPEEKKWISRPHYLVILCDIVLIVGAVMVWYKIKQDLPPAESKVKVISQQWAWTFVHPGPDNQLDTADDITTIDELVLQEDTLYHYILESKDVLHSFSVPVFRLKQDAVPGRRITGWFQATATGTYDIQCAEMCGIGHGIMAAKVVIKSKQEHQAWLNDNSQARPPVKLVMKE